MPALALSQRLEPGSSSPRWSREGGVLVQQREHGERSSSDRCYKGKYSGARMRMTLATTHGCHSHPLPRASGRICTPPASALSLYLLQVSLFACLTPPITWPRWMPPLLALPIGCRPL